MTAVPPSSRAGTGHNRGGQLEQPLAVYWRRGRRWVTLHDTNIASMWEFWEKTGLRAGWRACGRYFRIYCCEMVGACQLCGCILAAPLLGLCAMVAKYVFYMMPSSMEGLRCCSESLLLCSMWQGWDTNCIAILGWLCWLCDLHCTCSLTCRGGTWLFVCLAQREMHALKLVCLSCLAFVTPLYGKRPADSTDLQGKRQKVAPSQGEAAAAIELGMAESLRNARRFASLDVPLPPRRNLDLQHLSHLCLHCSSRY